MSTLTTLIPDLNTALQLEVEELAGLLIQHLNSFGESGQQLNRHNFLTYWGIQDYPRKPDRACNSCSLKLGLG